MQRNILQVPVITKIIRTRAARIKSLESNVEKVEHHLKNFAAVLGKQNAFVQQVALHGLLNQIKRLQQSIVHLEKENKTSSLKSAAEKLAKAKTEIEDIQKQQPYPPKKTQEDKAQDDKATAEQQPAFIVAGAGPVGYYAASFLAFAKANAAFKGRVVLVVDRYAELPVRNGVLNVDLVNKYYKSLKLPEDIQANLMEYITLRAQRRHSIKHLDMLGRAIYQALGGEVIEGTLSYADVQSVQGAELPVANVKPLSGAEKIAVPNVCLVLNAMGDHAEYPPGIERRKLFPEIEFSKNQMINVNVSCSSQFSDSLCKLSNKRSRNLQVFPMSDGKTQKIQIYSQMTKAESLVLDELVAMKFPEYVNEYASEAHKKNMHLVLKTFFFIEYISTLVPETPDAKAAVEVKKSEQPKKTKKLFGFFGFDNEALEIKEEVTLRDQIKSGKALCRAYETPHPSMPPQEIVYIPGTKALTTWIGAAALPAMTLGYFIEYSLKHTEAVLMHLLGKLKLPSDKIGDFKQEQLTLVRSSNKKDKTPCEKSYEPWLKMVETYLRNLEKEEEDLSQGMTRYFAEKYGSKLDAGVVKRL